MKRKSKKEIVERAKRKAKKLARLRRDPRYKKVLGRFKREGWLEIDLPIATGRLHLEDIIWVGKNIEPRVLELLPAVLIKKPSTLFPYDHHEEVETALKQLKKCQLKGNFMGIPLTNCYEWISEIGQKGKLPSITKNFRFSHEDALLIAKTSKMKNISESQILREALKQYFS